MKNRVWLIAVLFVIYFKSTQGKCQHEGQPVKRGYKYFTADCQKCVCRKKNKFVCASPCKTRKIPACENTFVRNATIKGTNCTCPVIRCLNIQPVITTTVTTTTPTTVTAFVSNDGKQFQLHLIIIIVVLIIFLIVIIILTLLWRCHSTNSGFWKSVSQHEEKSDEKTWEMTKRPLPSVPPESTAVNMSSSTLHRHDNSDVLKPGNQNHVPTSVPNPYVTTNTTHAQKKQNGSNNSYSYPNVDKIDAPLPAGENTQHYQELDTVRPESIITYEVPNDSQHSVYTALNDVNDYCNGERISLTSENNDYLQPA